MFFVAIQLRFLGLLIFPVFWLSVACLVFGGQGTSRAGEPVRASDAKWITTVKQLRGLSPAEAADKMQVRITGVITYLEPFRSIAFVQDETGGTYFPLGLPYDDPRRQEGVPFKVGDRVEVKGVSGAGDFAPILYRSRDSSIEPIKVLESATAMPEPVLLTPGNLLDPSRDSLWVETTGVVRHAAIFERRLVLQLTNGFEEFSVVIPGDWSKGTPAKEYVGASLRVRGVDGVRADSKRQLIGVQIFTPDLSYVTRLDQGVEQAMAELPVPVSQLLQFRNSSADRLHIRGTVTAAFPGREFYVRDGQASIAVSSNQQRLPAPGDEVDVVAYKLITNGLVGLHTPVVRVRAKSAAPAPLLVAPEDLASVRWRGELVRTQASLLEVFVSGRDCLILLSAADRTFSARLTLKEGELAPTFPTHSWLELTGIARVDTGPVQQPLEPWAQVRTAPVSSFGLVLRGSEDLRLLRAPPFWTPNRVLLALSLGALGLVLIIGWNALLQWRVRQMGIELSKKIEREQITAERVRIAHELHDTVEQELAGIGMQLDLAQTRATRSPERVLPVLELALRMLRRTQQETRASIQDLRSGLLERVDLPTALRECVENLRKEQQANIELELDLLPRRLDAVTEHNLLRICQEALTNAMRHARATLIRVRLSNHADSVDLSVEDNGTGFDPALSYPGHFGLLGMKERAGKIGATLTTESQPDRGTHIRVHLPLPKHHD